MVWRMLVALAAFIAVACAPASAFAQTTLHTEGFSNIPAQYIVFDNLDVSKAVLSANSPAISKSTVANTFSQNRALPSIIWRVPAGNSASLSNPFSIHFPNAGYDADNGTRVDLVLTCTELNAKVLKGKAPVTTNICIIYNGFANGKIGLEDLKLSNMAKAGNTSCYAVKQTYDVRVYKAGTSTTTSRSLLCYVNDLDTADGTGSSYSWKGAYAEGIYLISGYGKDTYVVRNTKVVAENSNTRFRGSAEDENTELSAVAFTLNASGGKIAWTGGNAGCATSFFRSYAKQIKASSGIGGTIKASGTNAVIAQGKSITENVGWRTNKTYTITPAAGYKISAIKADGTAVRITNSARETYRFSNVRENHTIAATYTPITYRIAFNGNGATSGSTATMSGLRGATSYNLNANGFRRVGYTFTGWNTKRDGTGTGYANRALARNLTSTDAATVTLYAQWSPNKLTVRYFANGATHDTISGSNVNNQLLRSATYPYNGTNFAAHGIPNANGGTWGLIKPGFHATEYWLVGNTASSSKVNADDRFATVQDFASACGVNLDAGNATIDLFAEFAPDPLPERTVIVRIPTDDFEHVLDSGYGMPSFIAVHQSEEAAIRCLVDFANSEQADGYRIARMTVNAPTDAVCALSNSSRFYVAETLVDGNVTTFTMAPANASCHTSSTYVVNHVEIGGLPNASPFVARSAQSSEPEQNETTPDQPIDEEPKQVEESAGEPAAIDDGEPKPLLATGETVNAAIPRNVKHIVFGDGPQPDDTQGCDLSATGDGSVMGCFDEPGGIFVITSGTEGLPIFANEDTSHMFEGLAHLQSVDMGNLDLSTAHDLSFLFAECRSIESIDATQWQTEGVERTTGMLQSCTSLQRLVFGERWTTGLPDHEPATFPVSMACDDAGFQPGDAIPSGKATYVVDVETLGEHAMSTEGENTLSEANVPDKTMSDADDAETQDAEQEDGSPNEWMELLDESEELQDSIDGTLASGGYTHETQVKLIPRHMPLWCDALQFPPTLERFRL